MKRDRNWGLILTLALLIPFLVSVIPVSAVGTETLITSNTSADQGKPSIYGNYIAWVDSRNSIGQDIYLYNTATLQEIRITDGSGIVDNPDIQGDRLAWVQGGRDIYWYDISIGQMHQVPLDNAVRFTPRISGDRIVWTEQQTSASGPRNDVLMYDIGTNLTYNLTGGQPDTDQEKPAISGTIVVWEDHRRLYGNYDIYGIDTSGPDPAAWIEKPICTVNGDKTAPAVSGDVVVWEDARINYTYPHIHAARFSTTVDFWNSSRDDSFFDQQFSPSIYGDRIVWLDTWPDFGTYLGMYHMISREMTEPLTSAQTSIPSLEVTPRIYQSRVVYPDIRSGLLQVYQYSDNISITCPVADFRIDNYTVSPGETVHFSDTSSPVPERWLWEFGDGIFSAEQNPDHTYSNPGTFPVMLSVGNTSCRSMTPYGSHQVSVAAVPSVDFTASPLTGMAPLMVTFIGSATGNPVAWRWDFGDGTNGTGQNISHTYSAGGAYSVRLNATNVIGTGTTLKTDYVQALSGSREIATTPIGGIKIDNRYGGQFLTFDTGLIPDFSLSGSVLASRPPRVYGWQNLTFLTSDKIGFHADSSTVTGNLTGIIFQTNEIRPAGFSPVLGSFFGASYRATLPLYPGHASLRTDLWESANGPDNLTYQNIIHQSGFSSINDIAYTMDINPSGFGTPGDCSITMSVGEDWVAGFEGLAQGRNSTYVIATGHDSSGNYYGMVLTATHQFHDPATGLDYFVSDIPARYSFLSKFSLAKLSGSGNPFQLLTLFIASHIESGGGGGASVVRTTTMPVTTSPSLPDPGKSARLYSNDQGVITQNTSLYSTDGLTSLKITQGIKAKDGAGNPLSSISIRAVQPDTLPVLPEDSRFILAGAAYDLQPDNSTFFPPVSLTFTVPQAHWERDFMVKTYEGTDGAWMDLPTSYNPDTGLVTAEITRFCFFALFTKTIIPTPSVTETDRQTTVTPVTPPPSPTAVSVFSGIIFWIVDTAIKNAVIVAGLVILAIVLFMYGRKRRRDRVMYLL